MRTRHRFIHLPLTVLLFTVKPAVMTRPTTGNGATATASGTGGTPIGANISQTADQPARPVYRRGGLAPTLEIRPKFALMGVSPLGVNVSGMVKGGRPSPGAWGCAPTFSSPPRRLRRRGKKEKELFGDTPKPRQGG